MLVEWVSVISRSWMNAGEYIWVSLSILPEKLPEVVSKSLVLTLT